jgi:hypothetical protein
MDIPWMVFSKRAAILHRLVPVLSRSFPHSAYGINMAKKKPAVPSELTAFIKKDETTFHCDDGDWELNIQSRDDSDFKDELPPRSTVIAENGSGDCLFLKTSAAGKTDDRVYVYWHEEERDEVFAKSIKELIAASNKNKATENKKQPAAKPSGPAMSVKELEQKLSKAKGHERWAVLREFKKGDFGLDALPLLRRLLAEDDASMAILAAECIAKLGPEAATCEAGEASRPIADAHVDQGDLMEQLIHRGAKVWSYSGYANAYSACLDALVKLGYDPDDLCEFVQTHIGLGSDALLDSLRALVSVGTPEAKDLAKRAVAFWQSELNMSETKQAKALLASCGAKKKK